MSPKELPMDPTYGVAEDKDIGSIFGAQIPHSLGHLVVEALERLDDETRWVLEMYFYERLTYAEIGYRLGLDGKRAGWWRVNRMCLPLLKEKLAELGVTDETFAGAD